MPHERLRRIHSSLSRKVKSIARQVFRPRIVTIDGTRLRIPPNTSAGLRREIYSENYEKFEAQALMAILQSTDVVVEAGSAIGFIGLNAAKIVPSSNIHLVEANIDLIEQITSNFRLNGLPMPNIHHGIAQAGQALHPEGVFNISSDFWSSSIKEISTASRTDRVPIIDLNQLIWETGATVFVCDIEGAEFAFIDSLRFSDIRTVVIEVHRKYGTDSEIYGLFEFFIRSGFFIDPNLTTGGGVFVFRKLESKVDGPVTSDVRSSSMERAGT